MKRFVLGVDPGKINDPTGVVALRVDDGQAAHASWLRTSRGPRRYVDEWGKPLPVEEEPSPRLTFDVVHIERRPLEESYPAMVRYVRGLLTRPELAPEGEPPVCVLDCTGVGQAVADLAREAGIEPLVLVSITGGVLPHFEAGYWRTPKADLVTAVVVKLQQGELKIAKELKFAEALKQELLGFRVTTSASGRDSYGAGEEWREAQHDDLVLALAVATWWAARRWTGPSLDPNAYARLQC